MTIEVTQVGGDAPELIKAAKTKGEARARLKAFCLAVLGNWNSIKSSSAQALESGLEPWPEHIAAYRKALGLEA